MIDGHRVLGLVPARGGSKALLRKNLRLVGGKPLLTYTLDQARRSTLLDLLTVSSDDDEILQVAQAAGADGIQRPAQFATDDSPTIDAVLHALEHRAGFGFVAVLQPTSPLRTAADIDGAIRRCATSGAPACVSVCAASESPHWMFTLGEDAVLVPFVRGQRPRRRQDLPPVFKLNGAVYVARVAWLQESRDFLSDRTVAYVMPEDRSLDVDSEADLACFQAQLAAPGET